MRLRLEQKVHRVDASFGCEPCELARYEFFTLRLIRHWRYYACYDSRILCTSIAYFPHEGQLFYSSAVLLEACIDDLCGRLNLCQTGFNVTDLRQLFLPGGVVDGAD